MRKFSIGFELDDVFIETDATEEVLNRIMVPLSDAPTGNAFYREAFKQLKESNSCKMLTGTEIIEAIRDRSYTSLTYRF